MYYTYSTSLGTKNALTMLLKQAPSMHVMLFTEQFVCCHDYMRSTDAYISYIYVVAMVLRLYASFNRIIVRPNK